MRPKLLIFCLGLAAGLAAALVLLRLTGGPPAGPPAPSPVEAALDATRPAVSFDRVPLSEALAALGRQWGVGIDVDWPAIEPTGLTPDRPVRFRGENLTLAEALDHLLEPPKPLAPTTPPGYAIRAGRVFVSATHRLPSRPILVRAYDIGALLPKPGRPEDATTAQEAAEDLLRLIQDTIAPDSWVDNGGDVGSVHVLGQRMVVLQTWPNHRRLQVLLAQLRADPTSGPPLVPLSAARDLWGWDERVGRWVPLDSTSTEAGLRRKVGEVRLDSVTFAEALARLKQIATVPLLIDESALQAAGVDLDRRLSLHLPDPTFGEVLSTVLTAGDRDPEGLDYRVDRGVVVVTATPWNWDRPTDIRFYDLRDWLRAMDRASPVPEPTPADGAVVAVTASEEFVEYELFPAIRSAVDPDSWRENGGSSGTLHVVDGLLVVSQTRGNHNRIERLLSALRARPRPPATTRPTDGR